MFISARINTKMADFIATFSPKAEYSDIIEK